jgi:hypothetical protein
MKVMGSYLLPKGLLLLLCFLNERYCASRVQSLVSSVRHCGVCDLSFKKAVEFERHLNGRRHQLQLSKIPSRDELWSEFITGAKTWSTDCVVDDVIPLWSDDELSSLGLKYRSTCLHPSPTINQLSPKQKARLWRYIRDVMGLSYYSEMASIMEAVDSDEHGHLRVKEVFESFETYRKISSFITDAQKTLKSIDAPPIQSIVELACGHGLVGTLLAYRFHNLSIHLYDLHKRPTFDAFLRAFESRGICRPGQSQVLPNIVFHEADMAVCVEQLPNSIVVCIHGCGQVNKRAIELAIDNRASGWIVLPCCIEKDMYLGQSCCVQLSDDTVRY